MRAQCACDIAGVRPGQGGGAPLVSGLWLVRVQLLVTVRVRAR